MLIDDHAGVWKMDISSGVVLTAYNAHSMNELRNVEMAQSGNDSW